MHQSKDRVFTSAGNLHPLNLPPKSKNSSTNIHARACPAPSVQANSRASMRQFFWRRCEALETLILEIVFERRRDKKAAVITSILFSLSRGSSAGAFHPVFPL
jgi:hypothetical protein